jgi:hypothetical protein
MLGNSAEYAARQPRLLRLELNIRSPLQEEWRCQFMEMSARASVAAESRVLSARPSVPFLRPTVRSKLP